MRALFLAFGCLLLPITTRADDGWILQFDLFTHTVPQAGQKALVEIPKEGKEVKRQDLPPEDKEQSRSAPLTAKLTPSSMTLESPGVTRHFDFVSKRVSTVDLKANEFEENSLYGDLAFRVQELQNRFYLNEVLKHAKSREYQQRDMEALLGILKDRKEKPTVTSQKEGKKVTYSIGDQAETVCTYSEEAVPERFQAAFRRLLVYSSQIHPAIQREICAQHKLPEKIEWKVNDIVAIHESKLSLRNSRLVEITRFALPAKCQLKPAEDELRKIIRVTTQALPTHVKPKLEEVKESIKKTYPSAPLEAFLIMLDYALSYQEQGIQAVLGDLGIADNQDAQLQLFIKGLQEGGKDPAAAEKIFASIERKGLAHAQMIDVQIAVMKMQQNDKKGATDYFLKALKRNPYLTGVYHDLGGMAYNSFDMGLAWQCYDLGKKIDPKQGQIRSVVEFEKRLERDFPDFFLAPNDAQNKK